MLIFKIINLGKTPILLAKLKIFLNVNNAF